MDREEVLRINRALNKAAQLYRAAKARRLASLGLQPGQDVLLSVLAETTDGMNVAELASRLGIESPTATRTLARMENAALFRREPVPSDRRQVRIVPTDSGRRLIPAIERVWAELADEAFGSLSSADRTRVVEALETASGHFLGSVDASVLAED